MSDTPVAERLQVKRGRTLAVVDAPPEVDRAIGVEGARADVASADVVLAFVRDRAQFDTVMAELLPRIGAAAILWLAYPKLTSPLAGALHRDVIHRIAADYGLAGVGLIAIDTDWSAMRFKRGA